MVGTENSAGLVSSRSLMCDQVDLVGQSDTVNSEQNYQNSTTTRKRKNRRWSKEKNMLIIECY